jgi:hypothetical protein
VWGWLSSDWPHIGCMKYVRASALTQNAADSLRPASKL